MVDTVYVQSKHGQHFTHRSLTHRYNNWNTGHTTASLEDNHWTVWL